VLKAITLFGRPVALEAPLLAIAVHERDRLMTTLMKPDTMLMIPGPTPVPEAVLAELSLPPIGHRSGAFKKVLEDVQPKLRWIFQTQREVFIYSASGTGAMEGAISNVLNAGEAMAVFACGVFSSRWADIAKTLEIDVRLCQVPDGQATTPEAVEAFLTSPEGQGVSAVCFIHNETSTGVLNPLKALCDVVKRLVPEALILVDTVTSLGATDFKMDAWGVDVAVSGSQKGFMLPPGLAFLVASERAMAKHKQVSRPGFYFNFAKYEKSQSDFQNPYTPALTLIRGLNVALDLMQQEGLDGIYRRHDINKTMTRSAIKALGLPLFVPDEAYASPSVTSVLPMPGTDAEKYRSLLREQFNITVAGGQKDLKGKIFRIGHLGAIFPRDVLTVISALEVCFVQAGAAIEPGVGVAAAQKAYLAACQASNKEACRV
jgi:aspartate aminotransferase-like enzyme